MNIKYKKLIISVCVLLFGIFFYYFYFNKTNTGLFDLHLFNLKRGRAVLMKTNDNKYILFGAGQNTETIKQITKYMPFYKRKIDYLFIPSANQNQIGGMIDIIDRYEIGQIYIPEFISTSTVLSVLLERINKNKIKLIKIKEGDTIRINEKTFIDVYFPNSVFKYNKSSLPELVAGIRYGDTNIILFGNVSKTIQKYIFQNFLINNNLKHSVIEYYNSMPDTRVYKEILNYLKPQYIFNTKSVNINLISDGEGWYEY